MHNACVHTCTCTCMIACHYMYIYMYMYTPYTLLHVHVAGNFWRIQFSLIDNVYHFADLISDMCTHAHHAPYNRAYFMGLTFTDSPSSIEIGLLENFPLYGTKFSRFTFYMYANPYYTYTCTMYMFTNHPRACCSGNAYRLSDVHVYVYIQEAASHAEQ